MTTNKKAQWNADFDVPKHSADGTWRILRGSIPVAIIETQDDPEEEERHAAFIVRACNAHDALVAACEALIRTIDATGGVFTGPDGSTYPAGDHDWADLADAYALAKAALPKAEVAP